MKSLHRLAGLFLLALLALAACAPAATPVATEPPATEPPAGEAPAAEAPAGGSSTPELAPVVLSGPPMEVGSQFLYVDGSLLVAVPAGEFIMGHDQPDNPQHSVYLDDFWIYRTAVTNAMYARCVDLGGCEPPDEQDNPIFRDPYRQNDPVVGVDYARAAGYCEFVNGRLPTEAEWEKTARGPEGSTYAWGEDTPTCDLTNLSDCVSKTTDVTSYPEGQSYYEALDTAGNVFEWVADWYRATYYGEAPAENPLGPESGTKRSVRSSGFDSPFYYAELFRRYSSAPDETRPDLGFRCVIEDPTYYAPYCERVVVYGGDGGNGDLNGGGTAAESCPEIGIGQGENCGPNNTPYTVVTFASPPAVPVTINVPGMPDCQDVGNNQYVCYSSVAVSITVACDVFLPGDPGCPPGYTQNGDVCVPDGSSEGRCLPGFNFDPAGQCCSAVPGSPGANLPLPACPVGTYYANPPGACVPIPAAGTVMISDVVGLKTCGPGGGGDCEPQTCPVGATALKWCQASCSCIPTTAPC